MCFGLCLQERIHPGLGEHLTQLRQQLRERIGARLLARQLGSFYLDRVELPLEVDPIVWTTKRRN